MVYRLALLAAVAGLVVAPTPAFGQGGLIQNGGFEEPKVASGTYQLFASGSSFSGWTVTGSGNVAVISGAYTSGEYRFPAKSGAQWLDMTGLSNSSTGVRQKVTTTPGASCTLSFAIGNVSGDIWGKTSTVDVLVDGNSIGRETNSQAGKTQVWKSFSKSFTAKGESTTIAFRSADPSDDNTNGLDDVQLSCQGGGGGLPFGKLSTLPVPDPGEPADISSARLPPDTKTVEADIEITDAEIDQFLATLALVKRRIAENNALGACIVFGSGGTEDETVYGAVAKACLKLLHRAATAASGTRAAARRCRVGVVPVWRRGSRPSARKRRKAAAAYGRLVNASCRSEAVGRLKLRVTARGERAKLNRLMGKRARAGVARSASRPARDGPNAKMTVRWRRR